MTPVFRVCERLPHLSGEVPAAIIDTWTGRPDEVAAPTTDALRAAGPRSSSTGTSTIDDRQVVAFLERLDDLRAFVAGAAEFVDRQAEA